MCPWSLPAYQAGRIDVVPWSGSVEPLRAHLARVYTHPRASSRRLKRIAHRLNTQYQSEQEWLWSHPRFGHHSAPVPCLIQQDLGHLTQARKHHAAE